MVGLPEKCAKPHRAIVSCGNRYNQCTRTFCTLILLLSDGLSGIVVRPDWVANRRMQAIPTYVLTVESSSSTRFGPVSPRAQFRRDCPAKPHRQHRRDGTLATNDFVNYPQRDSNCFRHCFRRNSHGIEVFLRQDFAGCYWIYHGNTPCWPDGNACVRFNL